MDFTVSLFVMVSRSVTTPAVGFTVTILNKKDNKELQLTSEPLHLLMHIVLSELRITISDVDVRVARLITRNKHSFFIDEIYDTVALQTVEFA